MAELKKLRRCAIEYSRGSVTPCVWLYRNKPMDYFINVFEYDDGVMKPYEKDASGDPGSPINGQLNGLFFMAKNIRGRPPPDSFFGDTRLQVIENFTKKKQIVYGEFVCNCLY